MTAIKDFLGQITSEAEHVFQRSQSLLSFEQYLSLVYETPAAHLRNCAQYFSDMVKGFGHEEVIKPGRKYLRYKLFDAEFAGGEGRIFGQERVQQEIIGYLNNFTRAGRVDKLILLHGPNGSAKTSLVQAMCRAAEAYSQSTQGAIYHFSWIFPRKESSLGSMGFAKSAPEKLYSYAHLGLEDIDARVASEQRDHPLLLLSVKERALLFEKLKSKTVEQPGEKIPDLLKTGELSHKNRQIFDALLSSYHGNLSQVFRHVRVERFYFSRRYKNALSVVEPQMSVDANTQQITSDQSIVSLPGSLRHLALFEVFGPLVDANRGLVEYSDLLKRPLEAWKYLLVACEQAQVSVGPLSLWLDLILMATSNELHLTSFKEYPDWQSFKGRIELIRVPYLLDYSDEEKIYKTQLEKPLKNIHVAPHSIALAARWAVLTRLEAPSPEKYPPFLQEIIRDLSPIEKLELYSCAEAPSRLSQTQARDLKAQIGSMFSEFENDENYEGRFGASPREIRTLILNAAQDSRFNHLSVQAIFEQISSLITQKTSYEFLRREPLRGFRDPELLLLSVKNYYHNILQDEVRSAVGLYSKESYLDLFTRYILHVSAWTKKERFTDPVLGRSIDADGQFMGKIEAKLLAVNESIEDFRRLLITQIAAYKLENPSLELDYKTIFSTHLKRLKENVYAEQAEPVNRIINAFMRLDGNIESSFDDKEYANALALKEGLYKLGYTDESARCAMAFLVQSATKFRSKI